MYIPESTFTIELHALVVALSEALGLVGGKIVDHGKRVACMAMSLAEGMDLCPEEFEDLRTAALLHDAGVSRTRVHQSLMQLDWAGATEHCRDGAHLLKDFPQFGRVTDIILHHHTKWSEIGRYELDERTAIMANLVFLADRIDIMIDWNLELILNRDPISSKIKNMSGTFFNPEAVDLFLEKSPVEVFWLSLYPRHLPGALRRFTPAGNLKLNLDDLENIAGIFAKIVDNKSPFTRFHSEGVSRLCNFFGREMDLPGPRVQKLRIAGLLHDLGKLAVPDSILEKPSQLTPDEFQVIKRHPFETYYVLSGIPALEEIRDWAACHHEKMDGSGYPFHHRAGYFGIEHIIVMFSDIIQALIQDRPYRPGLSRDQVIDILEYMTNQQTHFEPLMKLMRRDYERISDIANQPGRME